MKISTKARYGTRALLDLALQQTDAPVQLKEIAQRQDLSPSYLEHLFIPLITAGIVKSARGSRGGVTLARSPGDIKLKEIVEALEGPISLVDCLDGSGECARSGRCATQDVWEALTGAIADILDRTTLEDLVERQRRKERAAVTSYDI